MVNHPVTSGKAKVLNHNATWNAAKIMVESFGAISVSCPCNYVEEAWRFSKGPRNIIKVAVVELTITPNLITIGVESPEDCIVV
jgi:hypothetical protein